MGDDMANGKTYTEVVLEFSDRLTESEQRIIRRLDVIAEKVGDLAKQGASATTLIGEHGRRLEAHSKAIDNLKRSDRIWGAIAATIAAIGAVIGYQK